MPPQPLQVAKPIGHTLRWMAVAIFAAQSAPSQALVPPDKIAEVREALHSRAGERKLRCTIEPISPVLLYNAPEIAAGYTYSIPLAQYQDGRPERGWSAMVSFTPNGDEAAATYLSGPIQISALSRDKIYGRWTYWVGRGTYSARLAISDDMGGVCRKEWTVTAGGWPAFPSFWGAASSDLDVDSRTWKLVSQDKLPLQTPDGTVRPPTPQTPLTGPPRARRLTILMHAPSDLSGQLAVIDVFEALLARIPAQSVRLVVFSLEDGCEIFRQDPFQLDELGPVEEAFASLGYRAVNVAELQTHPIMTPGVLLDSLVQRETREAQQSDAVLFLGLNHGSESGPLHFSMAPQRPVPPFYYIRLQRGLTIDAARALIARTQPGASNGRGGGALSPMGRIDFIVETVDKLKGKTIEISVTKDVDQAVGKIWKTIQSGQH